MTSILLIYMIYVIYSITVMKNEGAISIFTNLIVYGLLILSSYFSFFVIFI